MIRYFPKLLMLTAAASLAGCGGSSGSSSPSPTPSPTSTPTPTPTPVVGTLPEVCTESSGDVCTIAEDILSDLTLEAGTDYFMDGFIRVGAGNVNLADAAAVAAVKAAGVTLTIEPGVDIKMLDGSSLLVTRGSKIMAEGTALEPITFSSIDDNFDGEGEWGGIILQGFAPQYGTGGTGACFGSGTVCNVEGEGGSDVALFGGNDIEDNSGVLRYVRIAEGGLVAGTNNEINGLTLQGVGSDTVIEYVQVHNNLDDGVEWFGGAANAKYLVLTGNDDDDIDFDEGYQGNIQYALIKKNDTRGPLGSNDPRGVEANSSDEDYVPETNAVLANITVIGGQVSNTTDKEQPGMRLRGALTVEVHNSIVTDFDNGCVRADNASISASEEVQSNITLQNVIGDCDRFYRPSDEADVTEVGEVGNAASAIVFDANFAAPSAIATVGATTINAVDNGSNFSFDQTTYAGAVDPAATSAWWAGWTIENSLN